MIVADGAFYRWSASDAGLGSCQRVPHRTTGDSIGNAINELELIFLRTGRTV